MVQARRPRGRSPPPRPPLPRCPLPPSLQLALKMAAAPVGEEGPREAAGRGAAGGGRSPRWGLGPDAAPLLLPRLPPRCFPPLGPALPSAGDLAGTRGGAGGPHRGAGGAGAAERSGGAAGPAFCPPLGRPAAPGDLAGSREGRRARRNHGRTLWGEEPGACVPGGCGAASPSFPTAFVPFRFPSLRRAKQALPGRRPRPAAARGQNRAGAQGRDSAAVGILCIHRFPAATEWGAPAGGGSALRCQLQQNGGWEGRSLLPGVPPLPGGAGSFTEAFCWRPALLHGSVYRCFPVFVRAGGCMPGCWWLWGWEWCLPYEVQGYSVLGGVGGVRLLILTFF